MSLPLFIHVWIRAETIVAQLWLWWWDFKRIFLANCIIWDWHSIPLQTCHAWKQKVNNIFIIYSIRSMKICSSHQHKSKSKEAHLKHFCCFHPNKSTSRHLWARSSVLTRFSIGFPASINIRSNQDVEYCSVAIANCVCSFQAMDRIASMHD